MGFTRDTSVHTPSLHPSQRGSYLQRRRLSLSCHDLLWGVFLCLLSPLPTGSGGCSCPHEAAPRLQTQRWSHRSPCLQNWSCSPHQHCGVPDLTPIYPGLSWTGGPRWTTVVHHLLSFVPICPINHSSPSHIIQPAYYLSLCPCVQITMAQLGCENNSVKSLATAQVHDTHHSPHIHTPVISSQKAIRCDLPLVNLWWQLPVTLSFTCPWFSQGPSKAAQTRVSSSANLLSFWKMDILFSHREPPQISMTTLRL